MTEITVAHSQTVDIDNGSLQSGITKQTGQGLSVHHWVETACRPATRSVQFEHDGTKQSQAFPANDRSDQYSARCKHLSKQKCRKFGIVAVIEQAQRQDERTLTEKVADVAIVCQAIGIAGLDRVGIDGERSNSLCLEHLEPCWTMAADDCDRPVFGQRDALQRILECTFEQKGVCAASVGARFDERVASRVEDGFLHGNACARSNARQQGRCAASNRSWPARPSRHRGFCTSAALWWLRDDYRRTAFLLYGLLAFDRLAGRRRMPMLRPSA